MNIIDKAFEKAIEALHLCITHKGFSACSLSHDYELHTNYCCIWARDSSLTTIWTLPLNDPKLIEASKLSLETLLGAQTNTGVLPNYVYVNNEEIEYGGVSNICALDGAMLVVIAAQRYIEHTKDKDFLHKYYKKLEATYHWIAAHDSNNCGLLEMPESSDWADLVYRSYNVLYDDVLWYVMTLAFAKLKDEMGEDGSALRTKAENIKSRILFNYLPNETNIAEHRPPHAFSQFNLVHTPYLIEQTGPHSYGWRCDVYANLLAGIFDVVDDEQRETTYFYIKQTGIAEPYPIQVLYPAIFPGDPMWRNYQLVKVHNIPHHYHNGGIWPLAGGLWVRYLLQIGKRDEAEKAIESLALFCQQGMRHEWEFNEWGHGLTGRPMGKAFQAWSAASYIGAYRKFTE